MVLESSSGYTWGHPKPGPPEPGSQKMHMVLDRRNQPVISNSSNICAHLITSNTGSLANSTDPPSLRPLGLQWEIPRQLLQVPGFQPRVLQPLLLPCPGSSLIWPLGPQFHFLFEYATFGFLLINWQGKKHLLLPIHGLHWNWAGTFPAPPARGGS